MKPINWPIITNVVVGSSLIAGGIGIIKTHRYVFWGRVTDLAEFGVPLGTVMILMGLCFVRRALKKRGRRDGSSSN